MFFHEVSVLALALFDLDNTLLAGDSDYLWGVFLGEKQVVDAAFYESENERFYQEYREGRLDIMEFLAFSLKPLADVPLQRLLQLREEFLSEKIDPIIPPASFELIQKHRQQGDTLMIITATNAFVTRPIADRLGIENLIATEPEVVDGHYTGKVSGEPSFQQGKVKRLQQWMDQHGATLEGSYFYSDSHNDIPLMDEVEYAVAVDPDNRLSEYALEKQWPVISLRDR